VDQLGSDYWRTMAHYCLPVQHFVFSMPPITSFYIYILEIMIAIFLHWCLPHDVLVPARNELLGIRTSMFSISVQKNDYNNLEDKVKMFLYNQM
jgi:hypothetical protein